MSADTAGDTSDEATQRGARDAGLDALLELDPGLVARAQALARGYAKRLRRPDSASVEPAHVYRPRRDT
jgi:hypothetical protein